MTAPSEDPLVCRCYAVGADTIRRAVRERELKLVDEVTAVTRAGGGCSSCWDDIQEILNQVWGASGPPPSGEDAGLDRAEKRKRVRKLIEEELDPLFRSNGLDCQLVDVGDDRVLARFSGSAVGTPAPAFLAIKRHLVERMSDACGRRMKLVELNVLESLDRKDGP